MRAEAAGPPTRHQMGPHFTISPNRPAASEHQNRRGKNSKVKRGRPPGPRMLCGWRHDDEITASRMRAHFTACAEPGRTGNCSLADRLTILDRIRPLATNPIYPDRGPSPRLAAFQTGRSGWELAPQRFAK